MLIVREMRFMNNKVIFESVKELCDFCFVVFGTMPKPEEIETAQNSGYIRRNPVEEAEEMFQKVTIPFTLNLNQRDDVIEILHERLDCVNKQHEAIQYLKERQK